MGEDFSMIRRVVSLDSFVSYLGESEDTACDQIGNSSLVLMGQAMLRRPAKDVIGVPLGRRQSRLNLSREGLVQEGRDWWLISVKEDIHRNFVISDAKRFARIEDRTIHPQAPVDHAE